jgi:DNA transposition AAA+ family ATPase
MSIRDDWKQFLAEHPWLSIADIAQHTSLGYSTVKNFLAGSQPETERIAKELERALELAKAGDILRPSDGVITISEEHAKRARPVTKRGQFYETETVRKIAIVLEHCAEHAAIGVITGDYGAGKTEAIHAWRRGAGRGVESVVYEFDEFTCSNKIAFVCSLAEMLGVPTARGTQNGGRVFRALCEHLRRNPCLLIFDQCEMVRVRVFQVIRQIWDHTREEGVGVVLAAAPALMLRLKMSGSQDLGALVSRVGIWAPMTGISKDEMAKIVKKEGITEVEESAFDLWWRAVGGSMRRLMAALELIQSKHAGKAITEKTVIGVAGHLWGMNVHAA